MDWIRTHTYTALILSAVFLLSLGYYMVVNREQTLQGPAPSGISAIGVPSNQKGMLASTTVPLVPTSPTPEHATTTLGTSPVASPFITTPAASPDTPASQSDDIATILSQILKSTSHTASPAPISSSPSGIDPYEFIPTGFVQVSTTSAQSLSPDQKALYTYGNDAGTFVHALEVNNPHQDVVFKNFYENQHSPATIQAMKSLASDYTSAGNAILAIDSAPSFAQAANTALGNAYLALGRDMAAIPDASDGKLIDVIQKYDATAEQFVKAFVGVADLFPSYNVKFQNYEAGSAFMFPAAGL